MAVSYQNRAIARARWRVAWKKGERVVSKTFGEDFNGALDLYVKAVAAGKKGATIICTNVSRDPPESLQPRKVRKVRKSIVTRGGRKKVHREIVVGTITPLKKLNNQGIWWCPYCAKLRRFEKLDGFTVDDDIWVPEPGYHCPICGVSHRDGSVRKHNPVAERIYAEPSRRLPNRDGSPRKRRRR